MAFNSLYSRIFPQSQVQTNGATPLQKFVSLVKGDT